MILSNPVTSIALPHSVRFFDGTLDDANWQLSVFTNGGAASAAQQGSGGDPNSYRQIVNTVNNPPPGMQTQVIDFSGNVQAVYDPQVHGAIDSIDYSEDDILISGGGHSQGANLALIQGGQVYIGPSHAISDVAWTTHQDLQLHQSDFNAVDPAALGGSGVDTTKHPDFSQSGAPIEFGFARSNLAAPGGPGYTTVGGIDNWSVTVNPVPPTYTYNVKAIDPDGDKLTYSLKQGPQGMTVDPGSGEVQWQPPANTLTANAVTYSDGTFNLSDWQRTTLIHGNGGIVTPVQQLSGGNPGAYLQLTIAYNSAPSLSDDSWVLLFQGRTGANYDPSKSGPIYSIDSSFDTIGSGNLGEAGGAGPALLQNGKIYAALAPVSESLREWTTTPFDNLSQDDFYLVDPSSRNEIDLTQHPDFSGSGAPIQFGFVSEGGTNLGQHGLTVVQNIDNWSVTVTPALDSPVNVAVSDGRGGSDSQSYLLTISRPSEVHGFVFNDLNGDGVWDRGPSLFVNTGAGIPRYDSASKILQDVSGSGDGITSTGEMAIGPDGNLYVSDWANDRVLRFSGNTGALIGTFVTSGSGGLVAPSGLTFGPDGNLYVASQDTDSVLRYNGMAGAFMDKFAATPQGYVINGITFGPDSNLYVCVASSGGSVQRYNGVTGASLGTFIDNNRNLPDDLAFDSNGNLYVSYFVINQVSLFDGRTGALIRSISGPGNSGLLGPAGVAVGPEGNLYVASSLNGQILTFNGVSGTFLDDFASISPPGVANRFTFSPASTSQPEPGLQGWTVFIDENHDGRLDPGDPSTTTDQYGRFAFTGLADGTYTIAEVPQAGYVQTAPATRTYQVTVSGGQVVYDINFGNQQTTTAPPNQPPAFTSSAPTSATVGQVFRYDAAASDPDGDPLTFDLPVKPAGMFVDPITGTVTWVPTADEVGSHPVTLRVKDGRGGVDLQTFTVSAALPTIPPCITSEAGPQAVVGLPYQYQVHAQDPQGESIHFRLDAAPSGMAIDPNTGLLSWTPTADELGAQHVVLVAEYSAGADTTQTFE
jgi:sugar lactone lactonase YvrE